MNDCKIHSCIANLSGTCAADECRGEILRLHKSNITDRVLINKFYNASVDNFQEASPDESEVAP